MQEFIAVFQLSKTIIFEVQYYTLGTNGKPHFATAASRFAKNKKGYTECGQAQDYLTRGFISAWNFYKKWDKHHLHDLTPAQYEELQADLQKLKARYNFMYKELDAAKRPYDTHFSFYHLAEWTKQAPKKYNRKGNIKNDIAALTINYNT